MREGFTWTGVHAIERKAEWPDWLPPSEMIGRQPYLLRFKPLCRVGRCARTASTDPAASARAVHILSPMQNVHCRMERPMPQPSNAKTGALWREISTAPLDRNVEVQIADEGEAYVLAFPCRRTDRGWINVVKNLPLSLEPTHWRERRIDR